MVVPTHSLFKTSLQPIFLCGRNMSPSADMWLTDVLLIQNIENPQLPPLRVTSGALNNKLCKLKKQHQRHHSLAGLGLSSINHSCMSTSSSFKVVSEKVSL